MQRNRLYILLVLLVVSSTCALGAEPEVVSWNGKPHFVYPYRQGKIIKPKNYFRVDNDNDIIPTLIALPDGDYITYNIKGQKKYKWARFKRAYSEKDTTTITTSFTLKNGKKEGAVYWYDSKGKVIREGAYDNDLKTGAWYTFDDDRDTSLIATYKEGLRHGKMTTYNYKESHYNYVEGRLDGPYFVTRKGVELEKGHYLFGDKVGKWTYHHLDGTLEKEEFYNENGKKHGVFKSYFSNGQLEMQAIYNNGSLDGDWSVFNGQGVLLEQFVKQTPEISENQLSINKRLYGNYHISKVLPDIENAKNYFDKSKRRYNSTREYLTGTLTKYYKDGSLKYEAQYHSGHIYNYLTFNHENGKPSLSAEKKVLKDSSQVLTVSSFYTDGDLFRKVVVRYDHGRVNPIHYYRNEQYKIGKGRKTKWKLKFVHEVYPHAYDEIENRDTLVLKKEVFKNGTLESTTFLHLLTDREVTNIELKHDNGSIKKKESFHIENGDLYKVTTYADENQRLVYSKTYRYYQKEGITRNASNSSLLLDGNPLTGQFKFIRNEGLEQRLKVYEKKGVTIIEFDAKNIPLYSEGIAEGELENGLHQGDWVFIKRKHRWNVTYEKGIPVGKSTVLAEHGKTNYHYRSFYGGNGRGSGLSSGSTTGLRLSCSKKEAKAFRKQGGKYFVLEETTRVGDTTTAIVYYPDGRIAREQRKVKRSYEGKFIELSSDGDTLEYKFFVNNLPHGYGVHNSSSETVRAYYNNGKLNGLKTIWRYGVISKKIYFRNDHANGEYNLYDGAGMLTQSGYMENGFRSGVWTDYNSDYVAITKRTYTPSDSININGYKPYSIIRMSYTLEKCWFQRLHLDGKVAAEGQLHQGRINIWKFYNEQGTKIKEIDYGPYVKPPKKKLDFAAKKEDAKIHAWYSDGKPKFDGKVISTETEFDCKSEFNYETQEVRFNNYWDQHGNQTLENGLGAVKTFHENGQPKAEGEVVNTLPDGFWKYYDKNGKLFKVGVYHKGIEEGRWLEGDLEGLNFVDGDCLNMDWDGALARIKAQEKEIDIDVTYYKNGIAVDHYSFSRGHDDDYGFYGRGRRGRYSRIKW